MPKVNLIEFTLRMPFSVRESKNYWVSSCPVLDVFSQGETKEQALENLKEAVSLFLISCYERNTLDAVMKECGFVADTSQESRARAKHADMLDVPIPFKVARQAAECHA